MLIRFVFKLELNTLHINLTINLEATCIFVLLNDSMLPYYVTLTKLRMIVTDRVAHSISLKTNFGSSALQVYYNSFFIQKSPSLLIQLLAPPPPPHTHTHAQYYTN